MSAPATLEDALREQLRARLDELRPAVEETRRLEAALRALGEEPPPPSREEALRSAIARGSSGPARERWVRSRSAGKGGPGARRRREPQFRREQRYVAILDAVERQPHISASAIAREIGLTPGALTSYLRELEGTGALVRGTNRYRVAGLEDL
jgi:hypothetical protein